MSNRKNFIFALRSTVGQHDERESWRSACFTVPISQSCLDVVIDELIDALGRNVSAAKKERDTKIPVLQMQECANETACWMMILDNPANPNNLSGATFICRNCID